MTAPIFQVSDLAYGTPDGRLLQEDIGFTVKPGQVLLITGGNGCGKSTLLRVLLGQLDPMKGTLKRGITFERVAYIPQLENTEIHLPLTLRDVLGISQTRLNWELALSFGLLTEDHLDRAWNTASGGERKRTLLTRALLQGPSVLVLDEPFNHLDEKSRLAMSRAMVNFLAASHEPRSIIMVSHQGLGSEEESLFDTVRVPLYLRNGRGFPC